MVGAGGCVSDRTTSVSASELPGPEPLRSTVRYYSLWMVKIGLGTDFGFYPNLGSIFDADFKISG